MELIPNTVRPYSNSPKLKIWLYKIQLKIYKKYIRGIAIQNPHVVMATRATLAQVSSAQCTGTTYISKLATAEV